MKVDFSLPDEQRFEPFKNSLITTLVIQMDFVLT